MPSSMCSKAPLSRLAVRTPIALAALAALAFLGSAHAEQRPFWVGATLGVSHDSNFDRSPTDERGNTIWSAGLLAGLDQPIGRQRVFANAAVAYNRNSLSSSLNDTSYSLAGGLDWETVAQLSGNLHVNSQRRLVDYGVPVAPGVIEKNVQTVSSFGGEARYGLVTALRLVAGADHSRNSYSATNFSLYDSSQSSGRVGLQWGNSTILTLGIGGRHTRAEYPHYGTNGDKSNRNDLDLTAIWAPTGTSTLNARVSSTRETHTASDRQPFSGVTGAISYGYNPGGRWSASATLSRDTGIETLLVSLASNLPLFNVSTSRLSTVASLGGNYALTGKTSLNARLVQIRSDLTAPGVSSGSDRLSQVAIGARWEALRTLIVGCEIGHESRSTNNVQLSSNYSTNRYGCNATLTLR